MRRSADFLDLFPRNMMTVTVLLTTMLSKTMHLVRGIWEDHHSFGHPGMHWLMFGHGILWDPSLNLLSLGQEMLAPVKRGLLNQGILHSDFLALGLWRANQSAAEPAAHCSHRGGTRRAACWQARASGVLACASPMNTELEEKIPFPRGFPPGWLNWIRDPLVTLSILDRKWNCGCPRGTGDSAVPRGGWQVPDFMSCFNWWLPHLWHRCMYYLLLYRTREISSFWLCDPFATSFFSSAVLNPMWHSSVICD